jgi:hypothetical protein
LILIIDGVIKEGLMEEVTFEQMFDEVRVQVLVKPGRRAFKADRAACAKTLRQRPGMLPEQQGRWCV